VREICQQYGVDTTGWDGLPALEVLSQATARLSTRSVDQARNLAITARRAIMEVEVEAAGRVRPYPGVQEMLARLRAAGIHVGIVTRNCREAVQRVLEHSPLQFDALLTRDDVSCVKPDPGHLRAALAAMRAEGTRVLMCGDHPMDVAAGKAIGALTAAVRTDAISLERLTGAAPDLILERVTDLVDHLELYGCRLEVGP